MLEERGLKLNLTENAKQVLIAEGYDPQYGARPLRRAIQRMIQDPLALKLLNGDFAAGDTVLVDGDPVSRALRFEKMEIQV
jgi:ATP-dependent Clp protease ATP-binding subunit ClpB